jgi:hypothetical protein
MPRSGGTWTKEKPSPKAFKPGQSGNPRGRPKIIEDIVTAAREQTPLAMATLIRIASDRDAPPAAQVAAAQALLDRGWGRPSQVIEGKDGAPLFPTLLVTFATTPEANALTIDASAADVSDEHSRPN